MIETDTQGTEGTGMSKASRASGGGEGKIDLEQRAQDEDKTRPAGGAEQSGSSRAVSELEVYVRRVGSAGQRFSNSRVSSEVYAFRAATEGSNS